jgi:hypothetical protein
LCPKAITKASLSQTLKWKASISSAPISTANETTQLLRQTTRAKRLFPDGPKPRPVPSESSEVLPDKYSSRRSRKESRYHNTTGAGVPKSDNAHKYASVRGKYLAAARIADGRMSPVASRFCENVRSQHLPGSLVRLMSSRPLFGALLFFISSKSRRLFYF